MAGQFTAAESSLIFDLADTDGNGEIDIAEFVTMMFPAAAEHISNLKVNFSTEEQVMATFNSWDTDNDGQLSYVELKAAVGRSGLRLSDEDINSIFVIGDIDQNGEIDLSEFMRMMLPSASDVVAKFRSIFVIGDIDQNGEIDLSE